jgi:hypothetical protein
MLTAKLLFVAERSSGNTGLLYQHAQVQCCLNANAIDTAAPVCHCRALHFLHTAADVWHTRHLSADESRCNCY